MNSDWQTTSTSGGLEEWGGGRLHFPECGDEIICKVKEGDPHCEQSGVSLEGSKGAARERYACPSRGSRINNAKQHRHTHHKTIRSLAHTIHSDIFSSPLLI